MFIAQLLVCDETAQFFLAKLVDLNCFVQFIMPLSNISAVSKFINSFGSWSSTAATEAVGSNA